MWVEVAGPVDLQLEGVDAIGRIGVPLQHISSGIGPIMRRGAAAFAEITERRSDQAAVAAAAPWGLWNNGANEAAENLVDSD